jgi:hypothetical protein
MLSGLIDWNEVGLLYLKLILINYSEKLKKTTKYLIFRPRFELTYLGIGALGAPRPPNVQKSKS